MPTIPDFTEAKHNRLSALLFGRGAHFIVCKVGAQRSLKGDEYHGSLVV